MTRVLLGLGSNVEPREDHIRTALDFLQEGDGVRLGAVSALTVTAPVGGPPQGDYLNGACVVETDLAPRDLMLRIQAVERRVGRQSGTVRWGPREVDIDILLYGDRVVHQPGLVVPHPRLTTRRFVLEPAAEVAGDMVHPVLRRSVRELLRALPDREGRRTPRVLTTADEMRDWVKSCRRNRFTVGLVPTMGALHAGHASLMTQAYREADRVVASIFVNPLQFDAASDLQRYPRTLEDDLLVCAESGVDTVFAPPPEVMFPPGFRTKVSVDGLSTVLEGAVRPGHFDGVTTVVCKLLALTLPDRAYFGQKDAQQTVVVRRMVKDLGIPCDIVVLPTVRDPDGLAMSSRNRFLSPEERAAGLALVRGLRAAEGLWREEQRDAGALLAAAKGPVDAEPGLVPDYIVLVDPDTLEPIEGPVRRGLLLVAARCGPVRLLDNVVLG